MQIFILYKKQKAPNSARIVVSYLFRTFSASMFASILQWFWWKMVPQIIYFGFHVGDFLVTFFGYRSLIDFRMHFGRLLVSFWLRFGSLLAPFGSLCHFWFPFGSLCPFCLPLGSLWRPFVKLYILWAALSLVGYFWVYFGSHFLTFDVTGLHFLRISVQILEIISYVSCIRCWEHGSRPVVAQAT